MTKEELKKEAIQYAVDYPTSYGKGYKHKDLRIAYLAGAEPREKRIAELEQKLEQTEKDLADYQFNYPTIKELQKENAELKDQHEVSARNMSSFIESLSKSENEAKKQLTKAKEIIHKVCYEYGIYDKDLMEEAKQFLNSEVEK